MAKIKCAIIGSGNIGTDLMIKVMRTSKHLEMAAMVGIDPASDGLARASRMGVPMTAEGIDGLTSACRIIRRLASSSTPPRPRRTSRNDEILQRDGKKVIDLTPAAIGPFVIPSVNGDASISTRRT